MWFSLLLINFDFYRQKVKKEVFTRARDYATKFLMRAMAEESHSEAAKAQILNHPNDYAYSVLDYTKILSELIIYSDNIAIIDTFKSIFAVGTLRVECFQRLQNLMREELQLPPLNEEFIVDNTFITAVPWAQ